MADESIFRQILENFTLVYLFTAFVVIVLFVLLGSNKRSRDTAMSIFRNVEKPAQEDPETSGDRAGEEARK